MNGSTYKPRFWTAKPSPKYPQYWGISENDGPVQGPLDTEAGAKRFAKILNDGEAADLAAGKDPRLP